MSQRRLNRSLERVLILQTRHSTPEKVGIGQLSTYPSPLKQILPLENPQRTDCSQREHLNSNSIENLEQKAIFTYYVRSRDVNESIEKNLEGVRTCSVVFGTDSPSFVFVTSRAGVVGGESSTVFGFSRALPTTSTSDTLDTTRAASARSELGAASPSLCQCQQGSSVQGMFETAARGIFPSRGNFPKDLCEYDV